MIFFVGLGSYIAEFCALGYTVIDGFVGGWMSGGWVGGISQLLDSSSFNKILSTKR